MAAGPLRVVAELQFLESSPDHLARGPAYMQHDAAAVADLGVRIRREEAPDLPLKGRSGIPRILRRCGGVRGDTVLRSCSHVSIRRSEDGRSHVAYHAFIPVLLYCEGRQVGEGVFDGDGRVRRPAFDLLVERSLSLTFRRAVVERLDGSQERMRRFRRFR